MEPAVHYDNAIDGSTRDGSSDDMWSGSSTTVTASVCSSGGNTSGKYSGAADVMWSLGFGRNPRAIGLIDCIVDSQLKDMIKKGSLSEIERLKTELRAMAQKADASEFESRTLRKQIVQEAERSRNLSRRVDELCGERDLLEKVIKTLEGKRIQEGRNPTHAAEDPGEKSSEGGAHLDEDGDVISQLETCKRNKNELEMEMEQLVLDYEILRQENHEISCKLQHIRLQEQLNMQQERSLSCSSVGYELENRIETLEKELAEQNRAFEAQLKNVTLEKLEQEKRAVRAENKLQKTRSRYTEVARKLQEEFRVLTKQIISSFEANGIAATKASHRGNAPKGEQRRHMR
ncbi:hypothetical protein MLD38_020928 [Melastoma candidum]|uniref:Uncharacterized protein n=1 Tax=Melastoma candidum TaxID=119954 RepID=A0ACB9QHF9_9MYRT|nr:hypothetical protein MLD38_020928 [Melastoma candidum]